MEGKNKTGMFGTAEYESTKYMKKHEERVQTFDTLPHTTV
jgi:hypothetical protein